MLTLLDSFQSTVLLEIGPTDSSTYLHLLGFWFSNYGETPIRYLLVHAQSIACLCAYIQSHSQPKFCYNILNVLRQVTFQNKYSHVSDCKEYCKYSVIPSLSHCAFECSEGRHIYVMIHLQSSKRLFFIVVIFCFIFNTNEC